MNISEIKILVSKCTTGIYLRWWFNGWHYFLFTNGFEINMSTESMGTQVTNMFSRISKIERPTKLKADYSYSVTLEGITAGDISGFQGLLLAEKVEQYEGGKWYEVDITRGDHAIKEETGPGYVLSFEITRKELPNTPAVYQKSQHLFINDIECDLDDNEVVPINKQVNDIAEMQDRQSDFTAQFKIRKTRLMMDLFELSGEVGANTTFPYLKQNCRYINSGIEMITGGYLILDKGDDQYYYASIYSGNLNFFKDIESLKLTDLTLASTDHTWSLADMESSHNSDLDYIYPLCEPSDDSAMTPIKLAGNTVELYAAWIWPFVKIKAIWDEIFTNSGYTVTGDILTNSTFLNIWLPISSLKVNKSATDKYLYAAYWQGFAYYNETVKLGWAGAVLINGDNNFLNGDYYAPYTAKYKIHISMADGGLSSPDVPIHLYSGIFDVGTFTVISTYLYNAEYEIEYNATAGDHLTFWAQISNSNVMYYNVSIVEITNAKIAYSLAITPKLYLPDISQVDFIKTICNMFGLIPEVRGMDHTIFFWNYNELYDNIPNARDWSDYLSEREDEIEFKFGEYAQNNYLKYKESDDVIKDNGRGNMQVDDETAEYSKDIVELKLSTCDEITINFTAPTANVSRIAFNKWDGGTSLYKTNESIDARIVYIKSATGKTFKIWSNYNMDASSVTITNPKIATSIDVSFSYLVNNYAGLSRILTKTNLRRAKFNLPVYEVAGLKHYIPIYLRQYKAYFYVNKINNYVPGQLCTIDLIKL